VTRELQDTHHEGATRHVYISCASSIPTWLAPDLTLRCPLSMYIRMYICMYDIKTWKMLHMYGGEPNQSRFYSTGSFTRSSHTYTRELLAEPAPA
jgi:hypothetical protein